MASAEARCVMVASKSRFCRSRLRNPLSSAWAWATTSPGTSGAEFSWSGASASASASDRSLSSVRPMGSWSPRVEPAQAPRWRAKRSVVENSRPRTRAFCRGPSSRSMAAAQQGIREQAAGSAAAQEPELVGSTGDADVQQVARLFVLGIGTFADFDQDDVVELEAFHLPHVGHVDAGPEGEVLIGDTAEEGHVGST